MIRVDSSLRNPLDSNTKKDSNQYKVPDLRTKFEPITREDRTSSGMLNWMQRQIGLGEKVNLLA